MQHINVVMIILRIYLFEWPFSLGNNDDTDVTDDTELNSLLFVEYISVTRIEGFVVIISTPFKGFCIKTPSFTSNISI